VRRDALVTGGSGFIGRRLVGRLVRNGASVVCPVRAGADAAGLEALDGVSVVRLADASIEGWRRALDGVRVQRVFHLAAAGIHPEDRDLEVLITANVALPTLLVECAAEMGAECIVHTGSCAEYAPASPGVRLREDAPIGGTTLYGTTKHAGFLCARGLAEQRSVPYVNLRLFGIYGPGEAPHRLLPTLVRSLAAGEPVALSGGEQVRDFLFVEDAVDGLLVASRRAAPGVYNLCTGRPTTVRAVAEQMADLLGAPRALLQFGAVSVREGETSFLVGDPAGFADATGWVAPTSLVDGLSATARA
jgi:nucleoside-diphosphate-sugar epimerase